MAKKNQENYDVVLERGSSSCDTIGTIATIVLTAAVVSGVGYVSHISSIDNIENGLRAEINRLEYRVIAEIREGKGKAGEVGIVEQLENNLKSCEEAKTELEGQLTEQVEISQNEIQDELNLESELKTESEEETKV